MIVRIWKGYAADEESAERYLAHFRGSVLPALKALPGYRGASLLRHRGLGEIELVVVTRWASMEAVAAFAGPDPGRAVVEPEARAALGRYDAHVTHYEVAAEA
jgi:heme-degrading monooxygenase HmoA